MAEGTIFDHVQETFAELHRKVVFGLSGGRIIWQPRIGCWYSDKVFAGEPLPAPYTGMDPPAVYRALGCSARVYEYNSCFKAVDDPALKITKKSLNETDEETTIRTPAGHQTMVTRKTASSPHRITVKWPVTTEDELKVATWRAERMTWRWDESAFRRVREKWGELGAPTMYLPRVNIQDLYINAMGVEAATYALFDWPDTVAAYFRALNECHDRLIDVVNASPVEIVNFGDNVHASTLSPDLFKKYVLPAYQRRCERLHRGGKFVSAHWDGNTGPLLPYARETGLDGIEAITPVPQGDVTLEQARYALGDKMFLLDGIPAVFFDRMFPESVLTECVRRVIGLFAPRLVLGISDEISSTGDIERVRLVGEIVREYNARQSGSG